MIRGLSFRVNAPVIQRQLLASQLSRNQTQNRVISTFWEASPFVTTNRSEPPLSSKSPENDSLSIRSHSSPYVPTQPACCLSSSQTDRYFSTQGKTILERPCFELPKKMLVDFRSSVHPVKFFPSYQRNFASSVKIEPAVEYGRIQHVGVLVSDASASKKFYMEVLCMQEESELSHVKLPFNCAFLRAGSSQIHLMEHSNPDSEEKRSEQSGRYVVLFFVFVFVFLNRLAMI